MKNIFLIGLFFAVFAETGCKKASVTQQSALPVNVVTVVEKEVNEWDEFTGRLDPVESVEIRPRVSGYITEIHFEAGAIVKKGDLLYVIDPRPYQADFIAPRRKSTAWMRSSSFPRLNSIAQKSCAARP